ncbi:Uncharacterised protein [Bordetella pertussis]|nr:Uncharacterised protein [Bordetella pertussis]
MPTPITRDGRRCAMSRWRVSQSITSKIVPRRCSTGSR